MSGRTLPTEEDLHAYLDGALPQDRRSVVEAYLRDHPEDAQRLQAYRADGDAIRRVFSRAGASPVLPRSPSSLRRQPIAAPGWRRPALFAAPWQRAAAIALIIAGALVAGIAGLWRSESDDALWARFGAQALAAHRSLSSAQPAPAITVSFQDISDYLSAALKRRFEVHNPRDPHYKLVGSRFVATAKGRVPQLAFQNGDGELVTLFLEPWPVKPDAPFREVTGEAGVTTMVWVADGIGCAASGTMSPAELEQIARSLYKAMVS